MTGIKIISPKNKEYGPFQKNVLITGGGGFIGANFVYKFLDLGYEVNLLEKKESNLWRLKDIKEKFGL